MISTEEYLATTWRPDRELIDGQLVERNVGEYDHSASQVAPGRYRIPDVSELSRDQEVEPVFTKPPLLCIEILSKDDSLNSLEDRVDDYLNFGVPKRVDTRSREAPRICVLARMLRGTRGRFTNFEISPGIRARGRTSL